MLGDFALVVIGVEGDGFVIALDEASAGSVIASGGESEAGVFRERRDSLHEAFAECGFANDQPAIMVLDSAGDDFRGGGGVVVDEDDEGHVHALIAADSVEAAFWGAASMIRNDELILFEEHITDGDGFVQKATGIAAHVEDESIESVGAEFLEGVGDFAVGGFIELRKTNVADAGFDEEGDVHGMTGDFIASNGEEDGIGVAFASDGNLDDSALGALEHVRDFTGGEAVGGLVVHFHDDVAGA